MVSVRDIKVQAVNILIAGKCSCRDKSRYLFQLLLSHYRLMPSKYEHDENEFEDFMKGIMKNSFILYIICVCLIHFVIYFSH